jgi:hypothetical protein
MKCKQCGKLVKNISSLQKKRNKNFFCKKECYLKYVRRDKIPNVDFFNKIDSEEKAYWLGFIVADGNVHKNGHVLQINLNGKDECHLQKFANLFEKKVKRSFYYNKSKNATYDSAYLSLSCAKIWKSLVDIGVVPNKTCADQSLILNSIKDDMFAHFLRGLFDGDGSISYSTVKDRIICNTSFAGEHRLLLRIKCNIRNILGLGNIKIDIRDKISVLRWGGARQASAISNLMYTNANIFLDRKRNIFDKLSSISFKGKFFGVTQTANGKWNASIIKNNKRIHIGNFLEEREAAVAYDKIAVEIGKPSYKINFYKDRR